MKIATKAILSTVLVTLLLSGCSDSPESVTKNYLETAHSGDFDGLKEIVTQDKFHDLNKDLYQCISASASSSNGSKDLKNDIRRAIQKAMNGAGRGEQFSVAINAKSREISKIITDNKYPIVDKCKKHVLGGFMNFAKFKILKTKTAEDGKSATSSVKLFYKNYPTMLDMRLKKDDEHGWQVSYTN